MAFQTGSDDAVIADQGLDDGLRFACGLLRLGLDFGFAGVKVDAIDG